MLSIPWDHFFSILLDMTRWKTEAHFASWLGLCPDNRITGGKVIRKGTTSSIEPRRPCG
ncbi:MAG: hypothetical protein DMG01_28380 [Acidobacteria bacterium]|nr:MAG: hypothetical protein DMG01_28380 [Acidobacteriota bacterium]